MEVPLTLPTYGIAVIIPRLIAHILNQILIQVILVASIRAIFLSVLIIVLIFTSRSTDFPHNEPTVLLMQLPVQR